MLCGGRGFIMKGWRSLGKDERMENIERERIEKKVKLIDRIVNLKEKEMSLGKEGVKIGDGVGKVGKLVEDRI